PQLLANNAPESLFQWFGARADVVAQGFVDQRLVIAAAGRVHLIAKPVDDILIEPYGDANFVWMGLNDRAAYAVCEVVLFSHVPECMHNRMHNARFVHAEPRR